MSHQPASLPSSLTHPTQPGLDLPGNLPEPLLPFSTSVSADGSQAAQSSQNPFLWGPTETGENILAKKKKKWRMPLGYALEI